MSPRQIRAPVIPSRSFARRASTRIPLRIAESKPKGRELYTARNRVMFLCLPLKSNRPISPSCQDAPRPRDPCKRGRRSLRQAAEAAPTPRPGETGGIGAFRATIVEREVDVDRFRDRHVFRAGRRELPPGALYPRRDHEAPAESRNGADPRLRPDPRDRAQGDREEGPQLRRRARVRTWHARDGRTAFAEPRRGGCVSIITQMMKFCAQTCIPPPDNGKLGCKGCRPYLLP